MTKAATKKVEDITAEAKKSMEQGVETMSKGLEEAAQFNQQNVEAIVASGKVFAKAAEEMNAEVLAFSKKSYEESMAAAKELTGAKTVSEFFEMQTNIAKSTFESYVAEATKLNDMYAAAAKSAFEPMAARFTAAADIIKSQRA
ncbi:MAG: phasin family protein [Pseudomonadota bacterium]